MLLLQNGEHVFLGRSLAQSSTFQICCAKTGKCVFSSALLPHAHSSAWWSGAFNKLHSEGGV